MLFRSSCNAISISHSSTGVDDFDLSWSRPWLILGILDAMQKYRMQTHAH